MLNEFEVGSKIHLGQINFTEQEIIDFAKAFDPLEFHINKEVAQKTIFKDIIASGSHIFNFIYRTQWIPRFGKSVICGLGISNWKFIKPVYANQPILAEVIINSINLDAQMGGVVVVWQFEFKNRKGEMVQVLQAEIMHHRQT